MKNKVTMLVTMALAVAFCTAMVVMADDAAATPAPDKACACCKGDKGSKDKPSLLDHIMKRLDAAKPALTDDQKTKIKDLVATREKKMADATDDKAKGEIKKELHKSIDAVLTAEQLASLPKRPEGGRHHGEGKPGDAPAPPAETK